MIAQCLAAAQKTVPENFFVHSMHCYFVLNGNSEIPIIYHVEHVREGRSFATRTVQARQRGQPIFTTTLSFMREGSGGKQTVSHQADMPSLPEPLDTEPIDLFRGNKAPFITQPVDILNNDSKDIHTKRTRQWIKCRGKISEEGGTQAHLSALAYMSDSYFIGTVARAHRIWRYSQPTKTNEKKEGGNGLMTRDVFEKLQKMDLETLKRVEGLDDDMINQLKTLRIENGKVVGLSEKRPEIGMMVSLDHSIFFHNPRGVRADDWLLAEAETPWAGDGRGYVTQRIFTRDGTLVASCTQEVSYLTMLEKGFILTHNTGSSTSEARGEREGWSKVVKRSKGIYRRRTVDLSRACELMISVNQSSLCYGIVVLCNSYLVVLFSAPIQILPRDDVVLARRVRGKVSIFAWSLLLQLTHSTILQHFSIRLTPLLLFLLEEIYILLNIHQLF